MNQPGKIYSLIPKIMAEVGAIEKTRENKQGSGYMFRGIDDVYFALQPLLAKYLVFFTPTVLSAEREERQSKSGGLLIYTVLRVQFEFFADDGSSVKATTMGEAMDSGDKSSNKAHSAALKVAALEVFCIPTEGDNDTENHSPEPLPRASGGPVIAPVGSASQQPPSSSRAAQKPSDAQLKRLHAIKGSCRITDEELKSWIAEMYLVESTRDLSLAQYDKLCNDDMPAGKISDWAARRSPSFREPGAVG